MLRAALKFVALIVKILSCNKNKFFHGLRWKLLQCSTLDCWGKGLRVCFEHLRILNFAPDVSVCCGACLHCIGAEASIYTVRVIDICSWQKPFLSTLNIS
jgi:hypothetical protein